MRKRTKIIGGSILGLAVLGVIGQATGAGADSASTTPPAAASTSHACPGCPRAQLDPSPGGDHPRGDHPGPCSEGDHPGPEA